MAGDYTFSKDYKLNDMYQTTSYKMEENSTFLDLKNPIPGRSMAMNTDPRTANQLQQLSQSLNQGASLIEVGIIGTAEFDEIPKQHFEEMRRKAKLAEAELSLHAPIVEISGKGEQGFDETMRVSTEKQLMGIMDRAIDMVDKKGKESMPVVIHAAAGAGSTYQYKTVDGKRVKEYDQMIAIDRQSGQLAPIKEDIKYYPMEVKDEKTGRLMPIREKKHSVQDQLESMNVSQWDDSLKKIQFESEHSYNSLKDVHPTVQAGLLTGEIDPRSSSEAMSAYKKISYASEHLEEAERSARSAFSKAYELIKDDNSKEGKEQLMFLEKVSKSYSKALGMEGGEASNISYIPSARLEAVDVLVNGLKQITPNQFISSEEFSIDKGSETLANVALHTYEKAKKEGKIAPTIAVENLYQGMGFSQASDLNKLIEKTQERFIDKAVNNGTMTKGQAKKQAEDMIGVTFDVGHLNISRKHGFTTEEITKEAKEFAKHVKHLHITDNFGYSDSHLPIGMGNVPMKAIYEAIEEVQGESVTAKMRKVNEVGGWFKNFQTSPYAMLLESVGSPIYSGASGPTWDTRGGFQQSYMEGYGMMLPDTHMQLYGAGFSNLPTELGGSAGQGGGRMGGGF